MQVGNISSVPAEILETLKDATTGKLYERAQMLINCGHSLSLPKALDIFGQMQENGRCEKPHPCPTCGRTITAYAPNLDLQKVVSLIEKIQSKETSPVVEKLKEPLAVSQSTAVTVQTASYYDYAPYASSESTNCDNCGAGAHKGKCHL